MFDDDRDPAEPIWVCQGCGRPMDYEQASEHKMECLAYRQSLTEVTEYDPADYDDY